jgi:hypothetical protein
MKPQHSFCPMECHRLVQSSSLPEKSEQALHDASELLPSYLGTGTMGAKITTSLSNMWPKIGRERLAGGDGGVSVSDRLVVEEAISVNRRRLAALQKLQGLKSHQVVSALLASLCQTQKDLHDAKLKLRQATRRLDDAEEGFESLDGDELLVLKGATTGFRRAVQTCERAATGFTAELWKCQATHSPELLAQQLTMFLEI